MISDRGRNRAAQHDNTLEESMSLNTLHFDSLPDDALVRMPIPLILTGWKKTQYYRKMKDGEIPRPVALGERARAWRVGDLRAYLRRVGSQVAEGGLS